LSPSISQGLIPQARSEPAPFFPSRAKWERLCAFS
jgi:hypothetical protein